MTYPRLALVVVLLVFPDRVDGKVVVRLHAQRHVRQLLPAQWCHGVPQGKGLLRNEGGECLLQNLAYIRIVADVCIVCAVAVTTWVGTGLVFIFFFQRRGSAEPLLNRPGRMGVLCWLEGQASFFFGLLEASKAHENVDFLFAHVVVVWRVSPYTDNLRVRVKVGCDL